MVLSVARPIPAVRHLFPKLKSALPWTRFFTRHHSHRKLSSKRTHSLRSFIKLHRAPSLIQTRAPPLFRRKRAVPGAGEASPQTPPIPAPMHAHAAAGQPREGDPTTTTTSTSTKQAQPEPLERKRTHPILGRRKMKAVLMKYVEGSNGKIRLVRPTIVPAYAEDSVNIRQLGGAPLNDPSPSPAHGLGTRHGYGYGYYGHPCGVNRPAAPQGVPDSQADSTTQPGSQAQTKRKPMPGTLSITESMVSFFNPSTHTPSPTPSSPVPPSSSPSPTPPFPPSPAVDRIFSDQFAKLKLNEAWASAQFESEFEMERATSAAEFAWRRQRAAERGAEEGKLRGVALERIYQECEESRMRTEELKRRGSMGFPGWGPPVDPPTPSPKGRGHGRGRGQKAGRGDVKNDEERKKKKEKKERRERKAFEVKNKAMEEQKRKEAERVDQRARVLREMIQKEGEAAEAKKKAEAKARETRERLRRAHEAREWERFLREAEEASARAAARARAEAQAAEARAQAEWQAAQARAQAEAQAAEARAHAETEARAREAADQVRAWAEVQAAAEALAREYAASGQKALEEHAEAWAKGQAAVEVIARAQGVYVEEMARAETAAQARAWGEARVADEDKARVESSAQPKGFAAELSAAEARARAAAASAEEIARAQTAVRDEALATAQLAAEAIARAEAAFAEQMARAQQAAQERAWAEARAVKEMGCTQAQAAPPQPPSDEVRWKTFELKWGILRGEIEVKEENRENISDLTFIVLPWPVLHDVSCPDDLTEEAMKKFIFSDCRPGMGGKSAKARIQAELLRYHPDKFEPVVLPKVMESEWEAVKEGVNRVVYFLHEMLKKKWKI